MIIIKLTGEIGWDILPEDVSNRLDEAQGDVLMHVDSIGGDVFAGVSIHQAMRNYKGGKIIVVISALAASAASYFVLAADELHVYDNSSYMMHEARANIYGGTASSMRSKADAIDGVNNLYIDAYTKKSGKSREQVAMLMSDETYFFGQSIVDNGFADKVLDDSMVAKLEGTEEFQRSRIAACKNNCKSRPINAKPPLARNEPNQYLLEVNEIMEKTK